MKYLDHPNIGEWYPRFICVCITCNFTRSITDTSNARELHSLASVFYVLLTSNIKDAGVEWEGGREWMCGVEREREKVRSGRSLGGKAFV